jgi:Transposase, Mutator family
VTAFFEDMKRRGLDDPLLVTSDGAPGIIKAIEICFPRAARQRCLAHRMRNLAVKLPEDVWPEFKVRAQAAYQAPSRAIALRSAISCLVGMVKTCGLPAARERNFNQQYLNSIKCRADQFDSANLTQLSRFDSGLPINMVKIGGYLRAKAL